MPGFSRAAAPVPPLRPGELRAPGQGRRDAKKRPSRRTDVCGAVDGARTRDLHLGKVALYQLSYYRIFLVRAKRLELLRRRHQILSLARLPFRHARTYDMPEADGK